MPVLTFHGDLASLLARPWRQTPRLRFTLARRASIKDAIEALGSPHTEIGRLLVAGREVDFTYLLQEEDEVEVFPLSPPVNVTSPSLLRPSPLPHIRFVADVNVGKLASLLRMLGFDTLYRNDLTDWECARLAARDGRIVLTRDGKLLKRKEIDHGRLVRTAAPRRQVEEVIRFYGLENRVAPFSRCLRCNTPLEKVSKEVVLSRLEPLTQKYYDAFARCPGCDRIYWAGSHRAQMERLLADLDLERSH